MNTTDIIDEIDAQISRLREAKVLLGGSEITVKRKPGRPSQVSLSGESMKPVSAKTSTKPAAKRTLSAEARAKIAAAQKARWAKTRKAARKAIRTAAASVAKVAIPRNIVRKAAPAKKPVSVKKVGRAKTTVPVTPAP